MINEKPLNSTIQKCNFYVRESDRELEQILKCFEKLKEQYKTKSNVKIDFKLNELSLETRNVKKNNLNYVKLLSETVNAYNIAFKTYEKNFEKLGESIK